MHKLKVVLVVAFASTTCRGGRPAVESALAPGIADACAAGSPGGTLPRNLSILMTDPPVLSRPADPFTRAERMVVRHLYETLVRVTCDGRILPALAESWTSADSGRRWTFTLRRFAHFWDGTPVLPSHVLTSWAGYNAVDVPIAWAGITHARQLDERRLMVALDQATPDAPAALADLRLAVSLPTRGSWPHGSGAYRPGYEDSSVVVMDGWDSGIPGAGDLPRTLEIHTVAGTPARDLIDRGVDLLVTDDRSLLEYAAARGQLTGGVLPWDRAYVLYVPATQGVEPPTDVPAAGFLEAVASEAVEVDARAAEGAGTWQAESCGTGIGTGPDFAKQPRRVVYRSGDETARALSHRLVTFAGAPGQGGDWLVAAFRNPPAGRTFPFAIGLEPAGWTRALEGGNEVAFVLAVPARALASCAPPRRADGWYLRLIETRARIAVRAGLGGVSTDWDGTPRITGPR